MSPLAMLHEELVSLIAALAAETTKASPDMAAVSSIRMKLSQASRSRMAVLEAMLASSKGKSGTPAPALANAVANARAARFASGAHIGKWTITAIEADWRGYCRDSAHVRAAMLQQIKAEATT